MAFKDRYVWDEEGEMSEVRPPDGLIGSAIVVVGLPIAILVGSIVNLVSESRKAQTLLRQALESYTQIGMPRHIEITRTLLDRAADR